MRQAVLVAGIVTGCLATSAPLAAQGRPDFSGEWTLATNVGDRIDNPLGRQATIAQNGSTLTITTKDSRANPTRTYQLDGTEARSTRDPEQVLLSRTRWVTNALIITTRPETAPRPWEDLVMLTIDPGGNLTVTAASSCTCGGVETITTFASYTRTQP